MKCFALIFLLLSLLSTARAASFTPVQDYLYCNSDAETQASIAEPNHLFDRHDNWAPTTNSSVSSTYLEVATGEYVQADSDTAMSFSIVTDGTVFTDNKVQMTAGSQTDVEITTDKGIRAFAWTGASTVQPGAATGNFYRIDPEAGEVTGDWVRGVV